MELRHKATFGALALTVGAFAINPHAIKAHQAVAELDRTHLVTARPLETAADDRVLLADGCAFPLKVKLTSARSIFSALACLLRSGLP
jgi:hypothetical protein